MRCSRADSLKNHEAFARGQERGILYVVATPLGNLRDISVRALEVLGQVDLIACEDTRHTAHLLAAHGISRPLISYFEHNEEERALQLTERLKQGAVIALVTDAGTPAISDPGYRLVRAASEAGCVVRSVPGPSAVTAALSIAGLPTDRFAFEGFLPSRHGARNARIRDLRRESRTMVFYEAARRLPETLREMSEELGRDRQAAVVRETTKLFEEVVRGTLGELAERWKESPPKGEITLVVAGAPDAERSGVEAGSGLTIEDLTAAGMELRQASKVIARLQGRSSREVYQEAVRVRRDSDPDGE
ncbi:MAG TPA: 16S rRNA (cytidine(1402)-2'-O)-methyltransferase [Candidatus Binataceae bacterium]